MSYSAYVKEELSSINNWKNKSLLEAEFLGYILTGNAVSNREQIEFVTENEFNIERFFKILFNLNIEYEPESKGKNFVAKIPIFEVVNRFSLFSGKIDDETRKTIIRGAFLGAGSVTDPEKYYHLEIAFGDEKNSEYISNLCKNYGVNFKQLKKQEKIILYIKEVEQISVFLACIGASKAVLKLEDIRIFKEMKNNVNRMVNCETANLNKTVDAAISQIEDINFLKKIKKFDDLSKELIEIANLRVEHPEASLKELGEMLENQIGKSGVNHRLKKIQRFAEEFRRK